MNLADTIYQKSLDLPPDKAQQVIDFIDSLKPRQSTKPQCSLSDVFEQAGLIGCIETEEQFSTTYKDKLNF